MSNLIGKSLGRYHILEQLGEGGMATVYKAYDTRLEADVAVKVIRTEKLTEETKERALKRFEREAKALARLTHPNIVKVMDFGEHEGKPYLVMPYLPGGTLKQKLGEPIPWQEALEILAPIARALDYAHRQGMIHRDVKPSNILITGDGEPMLTDFGIAKILDLEETLDLTGTSAAMGTPEYMAPEQAIAKTVDHRADIYSLGVVLYEMVTGRKPYKADTPMAVLIMHARDPLPSPRKFAPKLPEGVEKILLKALAKKPEDRYQSMEQFAAALKGLTAGNINSSQRESTPDDESTITDEITPIQPPVSKKSSRPPVTRKREEPKIESPKNFNGAIFGIIVLTVLVLASIFGLSSLAAKPEKQTPSPTPTSTQTYIPTKTLIPPTRTSIPPTFTPTPGIGSFIESDGVTMMYVPAGPFSMGSNNYSDEQPIHSVTLDAYYIDKYEVTNAAYKRCVDAGKCQPPQQSNSFTQTAYYGNSAFDDYPVIYVDWNMAKTYCSWRGDRLPTEAEWEKAARGTDDRTYPWGNVFDGMKVNFCDINCTFDWADKTVDDGYKDTAPVGGYESGKSPYGLYDMAGNVWEWVNDWYDENYYQSSPDSNPMGPSTGQYRALRGGSWNYDYDLVRASYRYWSTPSDSSNDIGFRCSRSQ